MVRLQFCVGVALRTSVAREDGQPLLGGVVDQQISLEVAEQIVGVGVEEPGSPKLASSAIRWPHWRWPAITASYSSVLCN
jgi:hypothetical protein